MSAHVHVLHNDEKRVGIELSIKLQKHNNLWCQYNIIWRKSIRDKLGFAIEMAAVCAAGPMAALFGDDANSTILHPILFVCHFFFFLLTPTLHFANDEITINAGNQNTRQAQSRVYNGYIHLMVAHVDQNGDIKYLKKNVWKQNVFHLDSILNQKPNKGTDLFHLDAK